jgi:hypothetical protein
MISEVDIRDWDTLKIELIKENEDGSADYKMHVGPKCSNFLMSYAFVSILKQAIAEGETFTPTDEQTGT